MKPCREIRKAVQAAPLTTMAMPKATTELASAAATIATASTSPAAINVRRSPSLATTAPAGSEVIIIPSPKRATMKAAMPTLAPRSRARSAIMGVTAPYPIELTTVGP